LDDGNGRLCLDGDDLCEEVEIAIDLIVVALRCTKDAVDVDKTVIEDQVGRVSELEQCYNVIRHDPAS